MFRKKEFIMLFSKTFEELATMELKELLLNVEIDENIEINKFYLEKLLVGADIQTTTNYNDIIYLLLKLNDINLLKIYLDYAYNKEPNEDIKKSNKIFIIKKIILNYNNKVSEDILSLLTKTLDFLIPIEVFIKNNVDIHNIFKMMRKSILDKDTSIDYLFSRYINNHSNRYIKDKQHMKHQILLHIITDTILSKEQFLIIENKILKDQSFNHLATQFYQKNKTKRKPLSKYYDILLNDYAKGYKHINIKLFKLLLELEPKKYSENVFHMFTSYNKEILDNILKHNILDLTVKNETGRSLLFTILVRENCKKTQGNYFTYLINNGLKIKENMDIIFQVVKFSGYKHLAQDFINLDLDLHIKDNCGISLREYINVNNSDIYKILKQKELYLKKELRKIL